MTTKNAFVCFCVDGVSDIMAIRNQFDEMFDDVDENIEVRYRIADYGNIRNMRGGDICTDSRVTPDNIVKKFYEYYFKNQDINSDLGWNELTTIIHVVDLDGAYIDDNNIREYTCEEKEYADNLSQDGKMVNTLYYDDHIAVRDDYNAEEEFSKKYKDKVKNPEPATIRMRDRNKRKRQNLATLIELAEKGELSVEEGKTVKYHLYYFSSNIDHYITGDANLSKTSKVREARKFSDKYSDADKLRQFILDNEYSTKSTYKKSWEDVYKGNNSLKKGTNINLLIEKIQNSSIEDWM